jgi:hypothetical protein
MSAALRAALQRQAALEEERRLFVGAIAHTCTLSAPSRTTLGRILTTPCPHFGGWRVVISVNRDSMLAPR